MTNRAQKQERVWDLDNLDDDEITKYTDPQQRRIQADR